MKTLVKWMIGIGMVAVVIVTVRLTLFRKEAVEVSVAEVSRGVVEETITNTRAGTVKVRLRSRLSPRTGGLVMNLPHREGDMVQKGELLLKLDDSVQRSESTLAEKNIVVAEARSAEACLAAELAVKEWERGQALVREGISSEQILDALTTDRDRTRAACKAALAAVDQSRASLDLARSYLVLTELKAPFGGIVAEVSTEIGEYITPAPPGVPIPPVIDLLDPDSIFVSAPIDEMDSEMISVGQRVYITVDSRPGEKFDGEIVRIAPYVLDTLEQNRTVEVEAEFRGRDMSRVLPGTSADIEIILKRLESVLRIPTSAIAEGGAVLIVNGDSLEERIIQPGLNNWQFTEIRGGISEGDKVVISRDSTAIRSGARVSVRDARD